MNAMVENLLHLDKELFLYLNHLGSESWDGFWLFFSNKYSAIPLYALLLFFSYRTFGAKATVLLLVSVAILILVNDQLANFFKYGVKRLRPCYDSDVQTGLRLVQGYCGGQYGYFSAHAANSAAVACFFSLLLKSKIYSIGLPLMIWACLVAYSRIYVGVHFPFDVLTGLAVGSFFGWVFAKLYIFALHKFDL
jgi:undecaprenyl-diphosphatase